MVPHLVRLPQFIYLGIVYSQLAHRKKLITEIERKLTVVGDQMGMGMGMNVHTVVGYQYHTSEW